MASYYDFVLALIPISLLGVSGALTGVGLDLSLAVPLGAAVTAGLIGHAMFVRAPIQTADRTASPAADRTATPDATFAPSAD